MDYSLGIGEILALASALTMATGAFFYGLINKKISPLSILFLAGIPALILQVLVHLFFGNIKSLYITNITVLALLTITVISTFIIGGLLFIKAIRLAGVSVVAPITSTTPIFTLILAAVFLSEVVTHTLIIGTIIIFIGVILLSIQKNVDETKRKNFRKGIFYTLIIAVIWSVSPILLKYVLAYTDVTTVNTIRIIIHVILVSIILASQKKLLSSFKIKTRDAVSITNVGVFSFFLTVIFYLGSMDLIGVSRATAISSIYPLFAFILAVTFLKEDFNYYKLIGTITIISGVILVTF